MKNHREESRSRFLIKNLLRGILWFAVIITAFILAEEYIRSTFEHDLEAIQDKPIIMFMVFFASEVIFGLIPPEFLCSSGSCIKLPSCSTSSILPCLQFYRIWPVLWVILSAATFRVRFSTRNCTFATCFNMSSSLSVTELFWCWWQL